MIFMCLATTVALPCGYKIPRLHHPNYKAFLYTFVYGAQTTPAKFMTPTSDGKLSDNIHPGLSIPEFLLKRAFPACARLSFALYAPLHLTWGLIRLAGSLLSPKKEGDNSKNREKVLKFFKATSENIVRSVLFLTFYVTCLWASVLIHSEYFLPVGKRLPQYQIYSYAWLSALFVLFERQGRQLDLGLYVSSHALNCIFNGLVERGSITPSTGGGAAVLALSAAHAFYNIKENNLSWPFSSLFLDGL
uniref:Uncharacterized protein n=1 Tax=Paramoeba aestuarina TaxID=180227 RepID=A0A7S4PMU7_9EUKA